MLPRTIGLVGYGQFGQFLHQLARRYLPTTQVLVYSRRATVGTDSFADIAAVAQADVVVICGAISEFEDQLAIVQQYARPDTVIVDIATVKACTEAAIQAATPTQPYICTHPMFGPASYTKCGYSVQGFRLVITSHTLPREDYDALKAYLATCGIVCIELSAAEHDRYLAETLFLTHFVAQTVTEAAFVRTEVDTVSFGYMMDAVDSVKADTRLFAEVYRYNPYCQSVIERFLQATHTVQEYLYTDTQSSR